MTKHHHVFRWRSRGPCTGGTVVDYLYYDIMVMDYLRLLQLTNTGQPPPPAACRPPQSVSEPKISMYMHLWTGKCGEPRLTTSGIPCEERGEEVAWPEGLCMTHRARYNDAHLSPTNCFIYYTMSINIIKNTSKQTPSLLKHKIR